ncbi:MAG: hypothetical protein JW940_22290 [Polyangiaceae bacterium]|nr:hypothetical protein [Polyangiaceae bacterium]
MQRLPELVVRNAARLFWDVAVERIDPERHEDFVIGRVLSQGDWETVQDLRKTVGDDALARFLSRAPHRLDRRTRRFFEVVLSAEGMTCTKRPFSRNSDALFSP